MTSLNKKQDALLKEPLKDFKGDARDLFGKNGLIKEVSKRLIESALEGEITDHPGYEVHDPVGNGSGHSRNGRNRKTVYSTAGELQLEAPRDRNGQLEPQIVRKRQRRLTGWMT